MDVLFTDWWSKEQIESSISTNESLYPSLIDDNIKIRKLASDNRIAELLKFYKIDVNAALVSTCRSDPYNCGRCAFWAFIKKHNCSVDDNLE